MTYKTAWRMAHEIRKHMARANGDAPLAGVVEIDEAMVGGRQTGKHKPRSAGKGILLGMMERGGRVAVKAVPDTKKATLAPHIEQTVAKGAVVNTDLSSSYHWMGGAGYDHRTVNHSSGRHVNGDTHTNGVEGFWFHLQKAIRGTHVFVSAKHLEKYAGEFACRFSRRSCPGVMLSELLGRRATGGSGQAFRNSFKKGFAVRIAARVAEEIRVAKAGEMTDTATGTALVLSPVYDRAARDIERFMMEQSMKPRMASSRSTVSDSNGYRAGKEAAESVSLRGNGVGEKAVAAIGRSA